jgi:organic radical activating enzyme
MLIGLFTILFLVLGGGSSEDPFILPNAQKLVKNAIEDPDRNKEAMVAMKSFSKDWKKLQKLQKKQAKALAKINKDLYADPHAIEDLFNNYRSERRIAKDQLIELRLNIQDLMTDPEWATLIVQIEDVKPKKAKKQEKAELKSELKKDKNFLAIESEIQAAFSDPEKIEEVKKDLDKFEDDLANLLFVIQEEPANLIEVMRKRSATRDELTEVVIKQEDYRSEVHASYLVLRQELVQLSTEDNWSKIAKALNKLI